MTAFVRNPIFKHHFDTHFHNIQPASRTNEAPTNPTANFTAKIKAQRALHLLLGNNMIDNRLRNILEQFLGQEMNHEESESMPASARMAGASLAQKTIIEFLRTCNGPHEKQYAELCQHVLASLETDIEILHLYPPVAATEVSQVYEVQHDHPHDETDSDHHHHHHKHHHHHHDDTRLKRLLKKCLGTSDVDEEIHGVVGVRAGITSAASSGEKSHGDSTSSPGSGTDHHTNLENFQHHEIATSAAAAAGDGILSGLVFGAGGLGFAAGRAEKKEGKEEKQNDMRLKRKLEKQRNDFLAVVQVAGNEEPRSETSMQRKEKVHNNRLLQRELRILDEEIRQVTARLDNVKYKIGLGRGSEAAGMVMMAKGFIDLITKPLAYASEAAAPVAASITGFAALPLSPAAAGAGLYMGVNSKKHVKAELKKHQSNLDIAAQAYALIKVHLPPEIRTEYDRFFAEGKWATREQGLLSFHRLMNWFVGGMSGYTAGITGLSAAKIAALIVGAATIADITASTAILVAVAAVLYGSFGFMKYHVGLHQHDEWARTDDPGFDKDFMNALAATGGSASIEMPVAYMSLLENMEANRVDFLADFCGKNDLRYKGIKHHSTDTDEIKRRRIEQKATTGNATERFMANSRRMTKNMGARAAGAGSFFQKAIPLVGSIDNWMDANRKARTNRPHDDDNEHGGVHRFRLRATAKLALTPALELAGATYAERTPYARPVNLARLFEKPESHRDMAAFMLRDVDGILSWTDKKLEEKISIYDIPDDDMEEEGLDAYDANFTPSLHEKTEKSRRPFWSRFAGSPKQKSEGEERSNNNTAEDSVAEHWRNVGQKLAFDKLRFDQATELRTLLHSWTEQQAEEHTAGGARPDIREAISRYLALVHEKIYDPERFSGQEKPMELQFSEYLLKTGKKIYRKKRSRLITVFLNTGQLRLDAALRKAEIMERKRQIWTIAHDEESGAPKIVPKRTRTPNTVNG